MRFNGKKALAMLLTLIMVLGMMPATASAAGASGSCGSDVSWSLNGNTLTISGSGRMEDYYQNISPFDGTFDDPAPWEPYKNSIQSITVENGVTYIGKSAFSKDSVSVTSVSLPSSLTEIGNHAFQGAGFTSITIPASVATIGEEAFSYSSLKSITIPSTLKYAGSGAFLHCENLSQITFQEDSRIFTDMFKDCTSLKEITIPGTVDIGPGAFQGCTALKTVTIKEGVTGISDHLFANCTNLETVSMPQNSLTSIGTRAFFHCEKLKTFVIPRSAPTLHDDLFNRGGLKNVIFPIEVKEINYDAFQEGNSYSFHNDGRIFYEGNSTQWTQIRPAKGALPVKYDFAFAIRRGITYNFSISGFGFTSGCTSKEPDRSGGGTGDNTGTDKPGGNTGTDKPGGSTGSDKTAVCTVKFDANGGSGSMSTERVESGSSYTLPDCAFTAPSGKEFKAWNINGKEYAPGKSLKVTGEDGSTLTVQAVWKDTAKPTGVIAYDSNGGNGFMPSKTLAVGTEFALPKCSYTPPIGQVFQAWSIDGKEYAPNATITVKAGTITVKALWKDGSGSTSGTSGNFGDGLTWELSANGTLTIQGRGSMPDYNSTSKLAPWSNLADKISSVVLKEGVYNIGSWAFVDCTWLSSVEIPDTVVFIGDCAFYNCGRLGLLNTVKLPDSVTYMAGSPFNRCHENLVLEYAGSKAEFAKIVSSVDRYDDIEIRYGKQNAPEQGGVSANTSFSDVNASAYYYDSVRWAVENRVTTGTSATTFSPDKTCTTAEILTFLWRASGSPAPKSRSSFSDIKPGDFYYKAALWAKQNELVTGDTFNGNTPCTRSATVTYLWTLVNRPTGGSVSQFTDVGENDACAAAVAWAVSKGITKGTSETTFSPELTCTRGQIVTFLYRFKHL